MAPHTKIIAVSRSERKLRWARELGAHEAVTPQDLREAVRRISPEGASVLLDFVGNDASASAIKYLEPGGLVVLVGMEGKSYPFPVFEGTVWQYRLVGSNYGTINEMVEMIELARSHGIRSFVEPVGFSGEKIMEAYSKLERGEVLGRFVIVPSRG
jgi:D-arabinose 1-dehydrogenase